MRKRYKTVYVKAHTRKVPVSNEDVIKGTIVSGIVKCVLGLGLFLVLVCYPKLCFVGVPLLVALIIYKIMSRPMPPIPEPEPQPEPYQVEYLDSATGAQFESAIANLMTWTGWTNINISGGANDRGADITGYSPSGRYTVVQCKRYSQPVGSPHMQKFLGTCRLVLNGDLCMVVTQNYFTKEARHIAEIGGIVLVDRDDLKKWVVGTWRPGEIQK